MQKFNQITLYSQLAWRYGTGGMRVTCFVIVLLCGLMSTALFMDMGSLFAPSEYPGRIAQAQSQNEVQIGVVYDGTTSYTTADNVTDFDTWQGAAPQPHTAGEDAGAQNGVVRTWDTYSVRVDWNINEDDATNIVLTVVLPAHSIWSPSATGMFANCDPAQSSISGDGHTLVCHLGDQPEGSNGVIRPVATLQEALDNTTFDVTATLTTDDDGVGVNDTLNQLLTVSEAPSTDWVKLAPIVSGVVNDGVEDGYVLLYELYQIDYSQAGTPQRGSGPINDSAAIQIWDHLWDGVPGATVATAGQMTAAGAGFAGRTVCGKYDGGGALPVTTGTWSCGAQTTGAGGYPVVPMTISGATHRPLINNADGSANTTAVVHAGQIAFWFPKADVDAAIADTNNDNSSISARFHNSNAGFDENTAITDADDVVEIATTGTSGIVVDGPIENNTVDATFGASPAGSGLPGFTTGHNIVFASGPLQLLEHTGWALDYGLYRGIDGTSTALGGIGDLPQNTNSATYWTHSINAIDRIDQVARGQVLTIMGTARGSTPDEDGPDIAFSQCFAFDTSHYNLIDMPAQILVRQTAATSANDLPVTVGSYTTTANQGPAAHVETGEQISYYRYRTHLFGMGGEKTYNTVVEFTDAPLPTYSGAQIGINDDALTCNGGDAGPSGWVASTGDLSVFDTVNPGDGVYEGITRARVRTLNTQDVGIIGNMDPRWPGVGITAYFQVRVKSDIAVQTDNQELMAFTSHHFHTEVWDGAGSVPAILDDNNCRPHTSAQWNADDQAGDGSLTASGWCNNRYQDDGTDSFDTTDTIDWHDAAGGFNPYSASWEDSSGALAYIVGARLGVSKTNLNGINDIKDNGELAQFKVVPYVTGSTQEALGNVYLIDYLSPNHEFVDFISQPTTPGTTCTYNAGTIICRYSEEDPTIDTGPLPPGLPGGWPTVLDGDPSFTIEVRVKDAIANPDMPTSLSNRARARSFLLGPWDVGTGDFSAGGVITNATQDINVYAFTYMPLPADEGLITKSLGALGGPCTTHPTEDPIPAGWDTNCQMVDYEQHITYTLAISNHGNTAFSNIRFVDVLPYNGDGASEPASNTPNQTGSTPTTGDARTPASNFTGTVDYISVTGTMTVLVTADTPSLISRDPDRTWADNTWCNAPGGTAQNGGGGACPATAADVTAIYAILDGPLNPGETDAITMVMDVNNYRCDDIWTNISGLRVDEILLPVRSMDVSVMPRCYLRVGGLLWDDTNNDELADGGDTHTTFAGVEVHLYDVGGTQVATTTTDANGEYLFEGLQAGEYRVRIPDTTANQALLEGYSSSTGVDQIDSQVDPDNNIDNDDNGYNDSDPNFLFSSLPISLTNDVEITTATDGIDNSDDESQANTINGATPIYPANNSNLTVDFGFHEFPLMVAVEKMLNTPDPVIPGTSVTFTIRITNTGQVMITTLPLTDTYSIAHLTYVGIRTTPESDTTANNGQIVWNDLTQAAPNGFDMDFGPGDVNMAQVFTHTVTDTVRIYAPTGVLLTSRDVMIEDEVVVLSWSTVDETDLIGFHVLRLDDADGEPVRLTNDKQMILAQEADNGGAYRYEDMTGDTDANHHYVLEMVMADGTRPLMDMGSLAQRPENQSPNVWTVYLPVLRR
ncbi:MAG: SdrD B-like domain-containing protein [Chloroflexota bacterium]